MLSWPNDPFLGFVVQLISAIDILKNNNITSQFQSLIVVRVCFMDINSNVVIYTKTWKIQQLCLTIWNPSLTSLVFGFIIYIITIILQMIRSMHNHSLCHPSKSQLKQSGNDNYYLCRMNKDSKDRIWCNWQWFSRL